MQPINHRLPSLLLPLVVMLALAACTGDEVENPQIAAEKNQLHQNIEAALDTIQQRLSTLEAETPDTLNPESKTQIDRLRQIESALTHRLEQIQVTTEEQWQEFRTDAERLVRDSKTALAPDTLSDTTETDTSLR